MNNSNHIKSIIQLVAEGKIDPDTALEKLKHLNYEAIEDFAKIDHHRQLRRGFPEVIWGLGKTPYQIIQIMEVMRQKNPLVMATRIDPPVYQEIRLSIRDAIYYPAARICAIAQDATKPQFKGNITIVTAGTADLPIAEEAAVTASLGGFAVTKLWDVGVAGIHRLLANRHLLNSADVLIVVAGMEGALPSVVAGLVDCPVIAVPTSIGYGANFGGITPLLTMLNSCATGVGVVNIDNGFGASMLAMQILKTAAKLK
jgi:hypothetical protein